MDITVTANDSGKRIDALIRALLPDLPLSALYRYIRNGTVRVDDKKIAPHYRLCEDERITLAPEFVAKNRLRMAEQTQRQIIKEVPHNNTLNPQLGAIIYQNNDIIALNKQSGATLFGKGSCQEAMRRYIAYSDSGATRHTTWGIAFTPSMLHRLDRNTSGILVFSKSIVGARLFSAQLRKREIDKYYIALHGGKIGTEQQWVDMLQRDSAQKITNVVTNAPPDGSAQRAETIVYPLLQNAFATLTICKITSGRTHQIRAQAAAHGHALLGDGKYRGQSRAIRRYLLHAYCLKTHPSVSESLFSKIVAPLPNEQWTLLSAIFNPKRIISALDAAGALIA